MIGRNNIFNIRYNPLNNWIGLGTPKSQRGFCNFRSVEYSVRACAKLIFTTYYLRYGVQTYKDIIYKFAPPSENDSEKYLDFICLSCNKVYFDKPQTFMDRVDLLYSMAVFEVGRGTLFSLGVDKDYIMNVLSKYGYNVDCD